MTDILSSAHRGVLEELAWSNVLLAFDYDGTLAPIVTDPDEAEMPPTTHELLGALTKVGFKRLSAAAYCIVNQGAIDDLLSPTLESLLRWALQRTAAS